MCKGGKRPPPQLVLPQSANAEPSLLHNLKEPLTLGKYNWLVVTRVDCSLHQADSDVSRVQDAKCYNGVITTPPNTPQNTPLWWSDSWGVYNFRNPP